MDIVRQILTKLEEESKQEVDKPYTLGVYRASEIGGCPRALQYKTLGYPAEPFTPETILIFRDGHMHEAEVLSLLSKIGHVSNKQMTISKKYKHNGQHFVITGTIDAVLDGKMVIDVKSMSTFRFKYLDKNYPQDFMSYVEQVRLYMDMLNLDAGGLLIKDKNSGELAFKTVSNEQALLDLILDRVAEIHRLAKEKKFIARPYGRNTWQCTSCQYRLQCWKIPMEPRRWARYAAKNAPQSNLEGQLRQSLKVVQGRKRGHPEKLEE